MMTPSENEKPTPQAGKIHDTIVFNDEAPTVRTLNIQRDKEEGEWVSVEIEVKTSVTTTTFDIAVEVNESGTLGDAEQTAYRKLVKHLEEAKELAQSLPGT
jgi:hypothetical protein